MTNPIYPVETIVSVWPMREYCSRPNHLPYGVEDSMSNQWTMEPGSIEQPALLRIGHYYNAVFERTDTFSGRMIYRNENRPAIEIANDLVSHWANYKGSPTGEAGKPGIFVSPLHGEFTIAEIQKTPEFLAAVHNQERYARFIVDQARKNYDQKKSHYNNDLHLAMGEFLKLSNEPWQAHNLLNSAAKTFCPYCASPVLQDVSICAVCHNVIDAARFAEVQRRLGLAPAAPAPVVTAAPVFEPPAPAKIASTSTVDATQAARLEAAMAENAKLKGQPVK